MKKMKIGIMPREKFQKRALDIAAGRYVPKRGEPKVWFSSMKSLSEVLSDNNVRLLQIIEDNMPETLKELAKLSGRQPSNLNRTLRTMERYGIVKLEKQGRTVKPQVMALSFSIQYDLAV